MSKPPLFPEKSAAGIAIDPRTLDRVIPESRRPDGTLRKERRIRPGFTPQEDVARFRGTRQQAADARSLPKGQILGWVTPGAPPPAKKEPLSKAAKKNEKRKEKRKKEKDEEGVRESWDSEEEGDAKAEVQAKGADAPNWAAEPETPESLAVKAKAKAAREQAAAEEDAVADKLGKLSVGS
ncbi:hypothetical protein BV25DRAFT_1818009 [Artomyces pyxidatus]|uniref:Uncharacterized protein n=1 Tax=Artomyces pyxidatus TaxID=48021 RepID=A0ACB8TKR2_9AGAM|nr:hypothetical protein BV25DRAFT_1818009 [Artomyces pyxidatus]